MLGTLQKHQTAAQHSPGTVQLLGPVHGVYPGMFQKSVALSQSPASAGGRVVMLMPPPSTVELSPLSSGTCVLLVFSLQTHYPVTRKIDEEQEFQNMHEILASSYSTAVSFHLLSIGQSYWSHHIPSSCIGGSIHLGTCFLDNHRLQLCCRKGFGRHHCRMGRTHRAPPASGPPGPMSFIFRWFPLNRP
jgi:hypothetical protein